MGVSMDRMRGRRTPLVLFMLALLWIGCSEGPGANSAEPSKLDLAPDFSLDPLDGGEAITLSELRGKTVVIDFWATWCPPCVFQVPELNAFWEAHPDIRVYGISIDIEGSEKVAEWVDEQKVRYPILLGDEELARNYGAVGFPTLVVIRPDGNIDSRHVGLIEKDDLEAAVKRSAGS